ncbi:uncharacterized protein EDB91DRAFT_1088248 [Suillus paluster]|uniref:uncharacterized protein n=1 Tax=Suillus paluster TaxID=48578 RepID=UPI001B877742|nr:uncharacterized protein EDB91DRAFT_1088248 [Suillus paluster]KAG1722074.1 hypothetical protein EDB91DRAFT_1088248 [Suillus paluster]
MINLIWGRKDGQWVDSLLAYYNEKLFGNENSAKPTHSTNTECSDEDDMIAMERQLATRAVRASRTSDATSAQSSAVNKQQELQCKSLPPTPDRPPTPTAPDSPVAQAPANPHKDKQPSPLPPSSPQEADDVLPAHFPLVNSHKREQASAPSIATIFNDDNPLTEEEPETI